MSENPFTTVEELLRFCTLFLTDRINTARDVIISQMLALDHERESLLKKSAKLDTRWLAARDLMAKAVQEEIAQRAAREAEAEGKRIRAVQKRGQQIRRYAYELWLQKRKCHPEAIPDWAASSMSPGEIAEVRRLAREAIATRTWTFTEDEDQL